MIEAERGESSFAFFISTYVNLSLYIYMHMLIQTCIYICTNINQYPDNWFLITPVCDIAPMESDCSVQGIRSEILMRDGSAWVRLCG